MQPTSAQAPVDRAPIDAMREQVAAGNDPVAVRSHVSDDPVSSRDLVATDPPARSG